MWKILYKASRDMFLDTFSDMALSLSYRTLMFIVPLLAFFMGILFSLTTRKALILSELLPKSISESLMFDYLTAYVSNQSIYISIISFVLAYSLIVRLLFSLQKEMTKVFEQPFKFKSNILISIVFAPVVMFCIVLIEWGVVLISLVRISIEKWLPGLIFVVKNYFSYILNPYLWKILIAYMIYTCFLYIIYALIARRPSRSHWMTLRVSAGVAALFIVSNVLFNFIVQRSIMKFSIYGSFGGVFLFLVWIYLSNILLIWGGRVMFYAERLQLERAGSGK